MIIGYAIAFLAPVLLMMMITPWVIVLANKIGAIDTPEARKVHTTVTPRLGGLAIFISMSITTFILLLLMPNVFDDIMQNTLQVFIIAASVMAMFVLGFWDDLKPLKPGLKFAVQLAVAIAVYYAGFRISNITHPLGYGLLNVEAIDLPLTVIWIVGVTNAFNLIDGLDGLSTGVAAIATATIMAISIFSGEIWCAFLAIMLLGALIGFLKFNFNPAKIFLGDSGSLLIGFSLALLSIQSSTKITTGFALLVPLLILILPITDTLVSMVRRFLGSYLPDKAKRTVSLRGKLHSMFTPDKAHIHHQLMTLGLSHRNTVLVLYLVSAFFSVGALAIIRTESLETAIVISIMGALTLLLLIKRLKYREISILKNGVFMPIYEKWVLNQSLSLVVIDLMFITVAGAASVAMWPSEPEVSWPLLISILIPIQFLTFWITGLYRESGKEFGIATVMTIVSITTYAQIATGLAIYALGAIPSSVIVSFLIMDFYFLLTLVLGIRIAYSAMIFWFNLERPAKKKVLIYGANGDSSMILHQINESKPVSARVLGFLDDDPDMEGRLMYGYPIFGGHWKLAHKDLRSQVDSIVICEQHIKPENLRRVTRLAERHGIAIQRLSVRWEDLEPEAVI